MVVVYFELGLTRTVICRIVFRNHGKGPFLRFGFRRFRPLQVILQDCQRNDDDDGNWPDHYARHPPKPAWEEINELREHGWDLTRSGIMLAMTERDETQAAADVMGRILNKHEQPLPADVEQAWTIRRSSGSGYAVKSCCA